MLWDPHKEENAACTLLHMLYREENPEGGGGEGAALAG